jgi:hypothetical protein
VSTIFGQYRPAVAMNPSGAFVIAWDTPSIDAVNEVLARRFDAAGSAIGAEFQVNTYTTDFQGDPAVAIDASGFIVVWSSASQDGDSNGVFGLRFASSGARLGDEFRVNLQTASDQSRPAIAADANGFVVVWGSYLQDGSVNEVFGRRFASSGAGIGGEFRVNVTTADNQVGPAVAANGSGFEVVWQSFNQDGSSYGIFGRRFDSSGTALGGEIQVNARSQNTQTSPRIAAAGSRFVVTWESFAQDGDSGGVFGRILDASGVPASAELQLSSYTFSNQYRVDVAAAGSSFVVVWGSYPQDGSDTGVFAQRLSLLADFDVDGNGVVDALTDTLLALRYAFGFRGSTLITGVVGANCTRCDAPSIEAYLATKM